VLAKVAGNLSTVATAMRGGDFRRVEEVTQEVNKLRLALIGVQIDETEAGDEGDAEN
jgi:hypothetical protein